MNFNFGCFFYYHRSHCANQQLKPNGIKFRKQTQSIPWHNKSKKSNAFYLNISGFSFVSTSMEVNCLADPGHVGLGCPNNRRPIGCPKGSVGPCNCRSKGQPWAGALRGVRPGAAACQQVHSSRLRQGQGAWLGSPHGEPQGCLLACHTMRTCRCGPVWPIL